METNHALMMETACRIASNNAKALMMAEWFDGLPLIDKLAIKAIADATDFSN